MVRTREITDPAVRRTFDSFPERHRDLALKLRTRLLEVAAEDDLTGGVEETLKWGEPSYGPSRPRVGSPVRIGPYDDDHVALFFNCRTLLVERFRSTFGDALSYAGNRAVLFRLSEPLPDEAIGACVRAALRYHLDKRHRSGLTSVPRGR